LADARTGVAAAGDHPARVQALPAWERWRAFVDFETLDAGSQRLVPQLCQRLLLERVADPLMGRIKGLYRRTWSQNQLLLRRAQALLRTLHEAGIETLVLKGAALIAQHYRDPGLRPMDDIDLLVHPGQVAHAIDVLRREAWRAVRALVERTAACLHATGFRHADGHHLDLHWRLLPEACGPHADDEFWRGARPARLGEVEIQTLHPTDNLFHTCAHGVRWNVIPPLRWVADAATIMATAPGDLDWDRLAGVAARHRLVLPIRKSLRYLRTLLQLPVPPACLEQLDRLPVARVEHYEYRVRVAPPSALFGNVPQYWFEWLRVSATRGWGARSSGFPGYVRDRWGCNTWADFAGQITTRGRRRMRALAAGREKE